MLIFAQHDLTKHPAYCNVDLISCRNMLIYIEPLLQKQVLAKFSFGLRKDGFLFLGSSESISSAKNDFIEINAKWKIFKRSGSPQSAPVPSTFPLPINIIRPENSNRSEPARANFSKQLSQELSEIILAESNLSGVCLDENFKVTRALGDVSLYLRQEQFNFNFKELLPETLSVAFSTAVHKVIRYNKRVEIKNVLFKDLKSSKSTAVDLVVSPYTERTIKGTGILVLFKKKPEEISTDRLPEDFHIDTQIKEHVTNLEEELLHIRQDYQAANELLESSKESMQSFNEELLSGNEELQSANEELQSMNEELESINVEHKSTIDELIELNDDLNNYFKSNLNGQLFVDTSLKLKKYSPGAVKHINIRERDIGRPLSNITTNIELETIIEDIKTVIKTEEVIIKEVKSIDNKIYQVMTSPYIRQKDNKTVGAIVTFYDITKLKETQKELDSSNKSLLRINEDLDNFVYAASHDLIAPINNIENVLVILNKKMDFTDPVVVKFSGIIANSIKNFKTVIKDLALVGSIEAEMRKESLSESFEELFLEIKESISDKIVTANATFSTDFQQKEIKFPRKNLRSILQNLISNALKFKDPNRNAEILIRTERSDEFILLTVRDNGLGIEKNQLDYIFKMYKRIDTQTEGQGIGLYLIKKIIDASGGKVEVESELGRGSTFKMYFKI